ncbi:MAG: hypothetical protein CMJ77_06270 [Planctomycetaceae bacterium]|nr:hypothetical protein [Planctomycetaceae bacterium]
MNQRLLRPERASDESRTLIPQDFRELLSAVCTSKPKSVHAELLESLAAAFRDSLTLDDCRRFAELSEPLQPTI